MCILSDKIKACDRDNYLIRRILERFTGDLTNVVDYLVNVVGVDEYQCAENPLDVFYKVFERFPYDNIDSETFYNKLLRFIVDCDE